MQSLRLGRLGSQSKNVTDSVGGSESGVGEERTGQLVETLADLL